MVTGPNELHHQSGLLTVLSSIAGSFTNPGRRGGGASHTEQSKKACQTRNRSSASDIEDLVYKTTFGD